MLAPLAQTVGVKRTYCHIWPGHKERKLDENLRWHVSRLQRVRDILHPCGITLGIEFLGPHHLRSGHDFIHSIDGALKLIGAIGPGAGLVLDSYHWFCSGGTLEELPGKLSSVPIVNVHLNDAMAGRLREQQQDMERLLPMETGTIDVRGILSILRKLKYDGPVIVEPFKPWTDRFKQMGPDAAAKHVADLMKPLLKDEAA